MGPACLSVFMLRSSTRPYPPAMDRQGEHSAYAEGAPDEAPLWMWLLVVVLCVGVMCAATWGGKTNFG